MQMPVYMDNHATTRVDPRVAEAMWPFMSEAYGNPGSTSHAFGWEAKRAVDVARKKIAEAIGAEPRESVFTSGATESNDLAIRGIAEAERKDRRGHIISVATEHAAVLDPLAKLGRRGFDVTLLGVDQAPAPQAGVVHADQVAEAIRDDTVLVSVMAANNEIGVIQPIEEIGRICRRRGVLFHTDAAQANGRVPLDVERLHVDTMSLSAHKMYGPKGVGALYVRNRRPRFQLEALIDGGGQERNLRSGTLNVPGIVGMARALELCVEEMDDETARLGRLRNRLHDQLMNRLTGVTRNGPTLDRPEWRLPGNLNVTFEYIDGESLLMSMRDLALSAGSACTSTNPEPSHVLRALGVGDVAARGSIRFGLGRFNTDEEVDFAVETICRTVTRLRSMSSMAGKGPGDDAGNSNT